MIGLRQEKNALGSEEAICSVVARFFAKTERDVELVYVFGSQITGHATTESDIDIAILLPRSMTQMQRFKIRLKLAGELEKYLGKQVDLVVLNDIRAIFFRFVIISEGTCCYARSHDEMLDFELRTMNEYIDFKPFLDEYNENYIKRNLRKHVKKHS